MQLEICANKGVGIWSERYFKGGHCQFSEPYAKGGGFRLKVVQNTKIQSIRNLSVT